jgi:hypothetical protein
LQRDLAGSRQSFKRFVDRLGDGGVEVLTLDTAARRYWTEVGKYHANSAGTWRDLERLIGYFGPLRRLVDISNNDVAELVAWRRGHRVKNRVRDKKGRGVPLVSPATVNRSTTQALQKLFTRAKQD